MNRTRFLISATALSFLITLAPIAHAQKYGGVLKRGNEENPPSASPHEESSNIVSTPFMPLYNGLVEFDQTKPLSHPENIVPDLATNWSWSADNKTLTFKLRRGVQWHDGKPFTAADVKCTWDGIAEKRDTGWRRNPRKSWYANLQEIVVDADDQVSFRLTRPQPSFLHFFAAAWSVVVPCHIDAPTMRRRPIGTGPFMVKSIEPGKMIRLVKNPNYFKPGRPYLDGLDTAIMPGTSTRLLAFLAGDTDIYTPSATLLAEVKKKLPDAKCEVGLSYAYTQLLINRNIAPFNDLRVRRALALAIDRDAVIRVKGAGLDRLGGELMPPPEGAWGLDKNELAQIPGYTPDLEKRQEEARKLMREAGYGPDKPLQLVLSTRDVQRYRDTSVLILDNLSKIFVKGEIKVYDTVLWTNVVLKKNYQIGVRSRGQPVDDPDVSFYESFSCTSSRNADGYCNKELEALFDQQSATVDPVARKKLVKEIDRKLQMDIVRPTITFAALPYCWRPHVKGYVPSLNNQYSNLRMENVWLDK